ncbi:MAG: orotate phosphoribosyltransferase [Flavobacteriales bacterium]|jgi:orotate phosphoribosyltransferase|nr:orotate phosphoribosyltransferase [Flavobacteriales bacterium]
MSLSLDERRKVAESLLRIKAIQLAPEDPFTWASGLRSPIYCDNRMALSHPSVRTHIRQQLCSVVENLHGKPDMIAGVATGGIAWGAYVAHELGLPFCYVRGEAKGHGKGNRVEGDLGKARNVVVIEDLISTGKSSLSAVEALREKGLEVKGMVAIFTYGFDLASRNFEEAGCPLETLSDYSTLIAEAARREYLTEEQAEALIKWREDAAAWSRQFTDAIA